MGSFRRAGNRLSRSRGGRCLVALTLPVLLSALVPGVVGVSAAMTQGGTGVMSASTSTQYSPPVWFPLRRTINGAVIKVGCTYLSHGTEGGYDCDGHHPFWALDLLAAAGTNIYPAGAGFAQNVTGQAGFAGYGNTVVVDHGNNVKSLYAHMSVVLVGPKGEFVTPTTVIGLVGETGDATTPHVHFEITSSGEFGHGSRDPGPLQACHGTQLITYPQAWGLSTWEGIPWGTQTGYSDGTGCTAPLPVPDIVTEVQKAATALVAAPAKLRSYGFMGLGGTKVTYSVQLNASPAGSPVAGAPVVFTSNGKPDCTAVTDTSGAAGCQVTYSIFGGQSVPSSFSVTYAGNSSYMSSTAVGTGR